MKTIEVPDLDIGEVLITREPGQTSLTLKVKSPLLLEMWKSLGMKLGKAVYCGVEFEAFTLTAELNQRFTQRGRYSLGNASSPLIDDENGVGPNLAFLRHALIGEGVVFNIEYPVNAETYAAQLGEALGKFLEDHLAAFKASYRFYFVKE